MKTTSIPYYNIRSNVKCESRHTHQTQLVNFQLSVLQNTANKLCTLIIIAWNKEKSKHIHIPFQIEHTHTYITSFEDKPSKKHLTQPQSDWQLARISRCNNGILSPTVWINLIELSPMHISAIHKYPIDLSLIWYLKKKKRALQSRFCFLQCKLNQPS